ncbi:MAG TPA: beta-galactosidase, partial [Armatimonadota bacterium]|nr:beta-galactosidase [Armatimonadota bacterium]
MRAFMITVLLLSAAAVCLAAEPVPVQNPSFEEVAAGPVGTPAPDWETTGAPPGWYTWIGSTARPGNPVLTWETTGGHTGQRCVSLHRCIGPVCVIQKVPVEPGERYMVSAWGKTSNPKSSCYFSVRWNDADEKWTGGQLRDSLPAGTPAGEWAEMQVACVAPDDARSLVILLTADGQGEDDVCFFDDVSVSKLGPKDIIVSPYSWVPLLNPEGEPPQTPHVEWAKPWAGGPLHVLFMLGSDHSLREQIEIAERMDIEYDYTLAHEFEQAAYALDNKQIMSRLEQGWYDVVVVAINAGEGMSAGLLDSVGADGGLVLVSGPGVSPKAPEGVTLADAPADHYLMRSAGALPVINEEGAIALGGMSLAENAPGRVARVAWTESFRCLTPRHEYEDYLRWGAGYWEGYLQTLIRAILWAGGREPATGAVMTPAATGARLSLAGDTAGLKARVWITDRLNRKCDEVTLGDLQAQTDIPIPADAASGRAMFSAIITNAEGQAVDFASCRADIPRAASITQVRPTQEWFEEGAPVEVAVQTAGEVAGTTVEVVMTDIYSRETARASVPAQPGETDLTLNMRDHLSTVNWLSARLLRGDVELDAARWYVRVPVAREFFLQDFQMGTWASTGYHPAYLQDAMLQAMRRAGITEGLEGQPAYLPTLAGGVWPVSTAYGRCPGFSRFEGPDTERKPCLSDPEIRRQTAEAAEQVATEELGWRPIFGYIRDETSLVRDALALDTCSTQFCQDRYRQWLQERYESLEALNAQWHTDYRSWQEPVFVSFEQAREAGNLAPWVMYRRFMDWVWADGVTWVSSNARRADPTAMCALANSFGQAPFSGRDYELLATANDYTMEYPPEASGTTPWGCHFEAERCFAPEVVHHPWIGYRHVQEALHYEPWWCALHGASGVSVYGTMSVFVGNNSWAQVFPTMQLTERGRIFAEVCRPLQQGLGKALMSARRPQPPIAILWSQPSLYAAFGLSDATSISDARASGEPYRQYFYSRDTFRRAIIASGRQFDY